MTQKVVTCIQARMGSTRLPEKVMADLNGATVIEQIHRRLKACTRVDEIVIATSDRPENKVIVEMAAQKGIACYAGSEDDLVDRLYQLCKLHGATIFVRVTADCPLVEPHLVDQFVDIMTKDPSLDYVTNIIPPTYPDGLDLDVVRMTAIERLWQRSRGDAFKCEWFNHDLRNNSDVYKTKNITNDVDLSPMRWTVDFPEDMVFAREVFKRLSPNGEVFHMEDLVALLRAHPEIEAINASYVRDAAYHKVLNERMGKL